MPARTTEAAVREIISTSLTTPQIQAFINDASLFVTEEVLVTAASLAITISTARAEVIERYLACALIRIRDLGLASVSWSKVSENYQVDPQVTEYLTTAMSFDPTGRIKAKFQPPEQPSTFTYQALSKVGETYLEDADDPQNTTNDP